MVTAYCTFLCVQGQTTEVINPNLCVASLFIVALAGLPLDQFEWQFADPSSSIARAKYRPGDVYACSCSL